MSCDTAVGYSNREQWTIRTPRVAGPTGPCAVDMRGADVAMVLSSSFLDDHWLDQCFMSSIVCPSIQFKVQSSTQSRVRPLEKCKARNEPMIRHDASKPIVDLVLSELNGSRLDRSRCADDRSVNAGLHELTMQPTASKATLTCAARAPAAESLTEHSPKRG